MSPFRKILASLPHQWFVGSEVARYEAHFATALSMHYAALGFDVKLEESSSRGRADMVVKHRDAVCLLEFEVGISARKALRQIKDTGYAEKYWGRQAPVNLLGVEFSRETRNGVKVAAERAANAVRVLDRFHIMKKLCKPIDEVRRTDARRLKAEGREPLLEKSRWLLKWRDSLSDKRIPRLEEILKLNLNTVRACLLKEEFRQFFDCNSTTRARKFLKRWRRRAIRSRIEPLVKFAATLQKHRPLVINWYRTGRCHSSGAVEGMNLKAKLALRRAFGFRSYEAHELALYHTLGNLPQPEIAHRFC